MGGVEQGGRQGEGEQCQCEQVSVESGHQTTNSNKHPTPALAAIVDVRVGLVRRSGYTSALSFDTSASIATTAVGLASQEEEEEGEEDLK